jgi:uncharacterized protein (DUF1501 family)
MKIPAKLRASTLSRRGFLRSAGALSAGGLFPALGALVPQAHAQTADYRALVCVFLNGGNDGNNTVVPYDDYTNYAAGRPNGGNGAALARGELLQIAPSNLTRKFGLHPNLAPLVPLFEQRKLAVLCNAGTLIAPLTRAEYISGQKRPRNLFSHSDQQLTAQGLVPGQLQPSGWGGRAIDVLDGGNALRGIPGMVSLAGDALFTVGVTSLPVALSRFGSLGMSGDRESPEGKVRYEAFARILAADRENQLVAQASEVMALAVRSSEALAGALTGANEVIDSAFAGVNSGLADQLYQTAKLIAGHASLAVTRQGFFTQMGGYDTHNEQRGEQARRFDELAPALAAFQRALDGLGMGDRVTTFTLSDFNRTYRINANAGTDHAWGNHHFVLGGAVKGGAFYGRFPDLTMGGPDDASDYGAWIPTASIEQYGATLARWFGVPAASLWQVFPNLSAFPTADLGFLA